MKKFPFVGGEFCVVDCGLSIGLSLKVWETDFGQILWRNLRCDVGELMEF